MESDAASVLTPDAPEDTEAGWASPTLGTASKPGMGLELARPEKIGSDRAEARRLARRVRNTRRSLAAAAAALTVAAVVGLVFDVYATLTALDAIVALGVVIHLRHTSARQRHPGWLVAHVVVGAAVLFTLLNLIMGAFAPTAEQTPATTVIDAVQIGTAESIVRPPTTLPAPEAIPQPTTPTTAEWTRIRVSVNGWDGLAILLSDGQVGHTQTRVLPGEPGRSLLLIPFDPSTSQTVIVNGESWQVTGWGKVPADKLEWVTAQPEVPLVTIISSLPGDTRPYVDARQP